ncbi:MAG: transporter substrate-binding domain-containing protein [Dialister sp.]|nr:transporter substrate-binding domain-containing protein [Dialister sp.]
MKQAMMKKGALILAAIGLTGFLGGCGKEAMPKTSNTAPSAVTLKVAGEATYPPMEYKDNQGRIVGFDIDLMAAIAREMKVATTYTDMPFHECIPALEAGKVDLVISAADGTKERAAKVLFSDVYFPKGVYSVLVRGDNDDIHSTEDLAGKTVTAVAGTTNETVAQQMGAAKVIPAERNVELFKNLEEGKADAVIADEALALYYLGHGGADKAKPATTIPSSDGFVIMMNKKDGELQKKVNEALKKIIASGEYDKIYTKWFEKSVSGMGK